MVSTVTPQQEDPGSIQVSVFSPGILASFHNTNIYMGLG